MYGSKTTLTGCAVAALVAAASGARADDPCAHFSWPVTHERALFASPAESDIAGKDAASAPLITPDHHYQLGLTPQEQVGFAAAPGKAKLSEGSYAGLVRLHLSTGGLYRVSLSQPFWVDAVADGRLITAADYAGAHGCSAPHKIVVYPLPAGDVLLQLSDAESPRVELTVTRAPQPEAQQKAAARP